MGKVNEKYLVKGKLLKINFNQDPKKFFYF